MKKYSSTTKANSRRILPSKHLLRVAFYGAVVLLMLVLLPKLFGYVGSFAIAPVVEVKSWIAESSGALPTYLRDRGELLATERDLRQQLAEHAGAQVSASVLEKENEELRTLLSAAQSSRIAAGVVGRPTQLPYDVFLIDRGANDGVVVDAPVYTVGDRVIGFVASVYNRTAVVALVTTPGYESTVYIYGPNIYTTAVGMGSGSLRVSVPQGITLSEGDPVVLPSLDTGVYGTLSVIDSEPSRPEQYGYVSMEEPLAGIRFVSVGSEPLHSMSFDEAKEVVESVREDLLTVPVPSGVLIDVDDATGTSTATTTDTEEL